MHFLLLGFKKYNLTVFFIKLKINKKYNFTLYYQISHPFFFGNKGRQFYFSEKLKQTMHCPAAWFLGSSGRKPTIKGSTTHFCFKNK
jgi:hypothetical protein